MRYILNSEGYIYDVSFGSEIECDLGTCTEYTGQIPTGYETIEDWFEGESDKLNAWKIIDGNLVFDNAKYTELQEIWENEAEENTNATHKWVREQIKNANTIEANNNEEIANLFPQRTVSGTLVNCKESGNFKIPKIKINTNIPSDVELISTNRNIMPNEAVSEEINGISFNVNDDKSIKMEGKSGDVFNGVYHNGFININTGEFFDNSVNPNSIYLDPVLVESGKSIKVKFNGGSIRFRAFNLDGSYLSNKNYTNSNGYYIYKNDQSFPMLMYVLFYDGLTDAQKKVLEVVTENDTNYNICGDENNTTPLFYLKKNIDYYLNSGYDLNFYNYDGTNRTLVGTYKNQTFKITDSDKAITQVVLTVPSGTKVDITIFIQLEYGTAFTKYAMHKENTQVFTVTTNNNEFEDTDLLSYNDMSNIYTINEDLQIDVTYITNSMYEKASGTGSIKLTSCFDSNFAINKLSITGFTEKATLPSETLYPSSTLYPNTTTASHTLVVDTSTTATSNKKEYVINTYLVAGDELLIESGIIKVIRADGTEEELEEPIYIKTFDENTVIYLKNFANLNYYCEYMLKSSFNDVYCTKTEKNASIKVTADEINSEVRKKVGFDEVISSINQTAEAVKIKADKISLEGTVTANNNFKILDDGSMQSVNSKFIMRDEDTKEEYGYAGFSTTKYTANNYIAHLNIKSQDETHMIGNSVSNDTVNIQAISGDEDSYVTASLGVDRYNVPNLMLTVTDYNTGISIDDLVLIQPNEINFNYTTNITNADNTLLLRCNNGTSIVNYNNEAYVPIKASAFTQSSSRRYKENIEEMTKEEADKILNLKVVTFDYKKDSKMNGNNVAGMIAEDVIDILPNTVTSEIVDGKEVPDAIDYSKFVPYLIKEIQLLKQEIKELKGEK